MEQLQIPVSPGSVYNFNLEAYEALESFDQWVKKRLSSSQLLHADETGINIEGKRNWLHIASNSDFTYFDPHPKRGSEALDEIGILCHDHWKLYYQYDCFYALCNAHHFRKLERAWEQDKQQWAKQMALLLEELNKAVLDAGGHLEAKNSDAYRKRHRDLLEESEKECPPPDES